MSGPISTVLVIAVPTRRTTSPTSRLSVKSGMCSPCCSRAATGTTTGMSRDRLLTSGQVISCSSIMCLQFGLSPIGSDTHSVAMGNIAHVLGHARSACIPLPRPLPPGMVMPESPATFPVSGEPPGAMSGVSRRPNHSQHTILVRSGQLDREIGEGTRLTRQEPAGLLLPFGEHGDGTAAVRDLSGDHAHLARATAAASTAEHDARPRAEDRRQ